MLAAAATGSPVKSQHNPFRHSADATSLNAPDIPSQTDLDIHPTSLERSPSPVEAPSPSTSPEPSQESPNTPIVPNPPRVHEETSTPRPMYAPPPGSPPRHSLEVAITEELPPAYTPTADVRQGETSVEFGPRRPFGNAPARPYAVRQAPQRPSWQPLGTGNPGWSGYPGTGTVRRPPPGAPLIHIDPPPQHPRLQRSVSPNGGSVRVPRVPQRPLSDFARDFYTAGARQEGAREGASEGANDQSGSPISPQDRSRSPPIVDDGRPTKKPVPGHPLLNSGKVLVYPAGYDCPKCTYRLLIYIYFYSYSNIPPT